MPVLGQELPPHLDVAILDRGELAIEVGLVRVPLGLGQLAIQEGRVGLVTQVVQPDVGGGGGGHGG